MNSHFFLPFSWFFPSCVDSLAPKLCNCFGFRHTVAYDIIFLSTSSCLCRPLIKHDGAPSCPCSLTICERSRTHHNFSSLECWAFVSIGQLVVHPKLGQHRIRASPNLVIFGTWQSWTHLIQTGVMILTIHFHAKLLTGVKKLIVKSSNGKFHSFMFIASSGTHQKFWILFVLAGNNLQRMDTNG